MRIVSLLPAATEIIYALGLDEQLVGVTFECDEPAEARATKTVVVGGRDTRGMTPGEIDAYVREMSDARQDLYTLRADALADLAPDVVVTQDLCRVCALPAGNVSAALDHLGCGADVITFDPHTLDNVLDGIVAIGRQLGAADQAEDLVLGLRGRLDAVGSAVADRPRPRVAVVEWVDPPFTAGHWVPDLVAAAGGVPVSAVPGGRSAATTWDAIIAERPDVAVVAPCGFRLDDASAQAKVVVDALPGVPVWALDGDGLVVRPGPRLIDGVEAIAAALHSGAVPPAPETALRRIA